MSPADFQGLSDEQVEERIRMGQINRNPGIPGKQLGQIILENSLTVFNSLNAAIITTLVIFWIVTDDNRLILDSLGVMIVVVANTLMAVGQEYRNHRIITNIQLLKSRQSMVIRGQRRFLIPTEDIVQDEVVVIRRGDQIPVDGTLLHSHLFDVDESLITGESVSIRKAAGSQILSGSYCVYGEGILRAERIGAKATVNDIQKLSKRLNLTPSPLQNQINRIFTGSFLVTLFILILDGSINTGSGMAVNDHIRKLATIAFTLIPEGLVFFTSATFLLGIWRIGQSGVLIQKLQALDTMASLDVMAFDKTGTLTLHQAGEPGIRVLTDSIPVLALLASFARQSTHQTGVTRLLAHLPAPNQCRVIHELPFDSGRKYSQLSLETNDTVYHLILGAPDVLESAIRSGEPGPDPEKTGTRQLLFGLLGGPLPPDVPPAGLQPLAILSVEETLNPEASTVLHFLAGESIRFLVISGDAPESVLSVLNRLGFHLTLQEWMDANTLSHLTDAELIKRLPHLRAVARATPEQKLRLIRVMKESGQVVAMIGDGVNDLPAIRESNLGIAMSDGSDQTRDAADMVLLKNRIGLIPATFSEGKRLIGAVWLIAGLYLTKNLSVLFLTVVSWFATDPFLLSPRTTSLLSLFTVSLPASLIALHLTDTRRHPDFAGTVFTRSLVAGLMLFLAPTFTLILAPHLGISESGLAFPVLLLSGLALVVVWVAPMNLTRPVVFYSSIGLIALVFLLLALVPGLPPPISWLQIFYETTPIDPWALPLVIGCPVVVGVGTRILFKWLEGK